MDYRNKGAAIGASIGLLVNFLLFRLGRTDFLIAIGMSAVMILLLILSDGIIYENRYFRYKIMIFSLLILNSLFIPLSVYGFQNILLPWSKTLNVSILRVLLPLATALCFYYFSRSVIVSIFDKNNIPKEINVMYTSDIKDKSRKYRDRKSVV